MSTTPSHDSKAVTKVMSMADNVVHRRNAYKRMPVPREFGRLDKSINELAESVEKCRKQGGQP